MNAEHTRPRSNASRGSSSILLKTTISAAVIALILSLCLGAIAALLLKRYDQALRVEALDAGIDEIAEHFRVGGYPDLHNNKFLVSFVLNEAQINGATSRHIAVVDLPEALNALPLDQVQKGTEQFSNFSFLVREIRTDQRYRIYYGLNFRLADRAQARYLRAGVVLLAFSVLISALLGYFYGLALVKPLGRLADELATLSERDITRELAPIQIEEIDALIAAINSYRAQFKAVQKREVEFLQNASHELRTPLSVVKGALELLHLQPEFMQQKPRAVLLRALRSGEDLQLMLEAFLLSAQATEPAELKPIALHAFVLELLNLHRSRSDTLFSIQIAEHEKLLVRPPVLRWVVLQILRSVEGAEQIKLTFSEGCLSFLISSPMATEAHAPFLPNDPKTATPPLSELLSVLCAREGWALSTIIHAGAGDGQTECALRLRFYDPKNTLSAT